ncbi:MAG: OmpA family protein [Candidatus Kapaibacterium sp.]
MKYILLCLFALTLSASVDAQTNHKVIFEDNFDGTTKNGWYVGGSFNLKTSISNGVYRMENLTKSNSSVWSIKSVGLKKEDNFIIEFDARQTEGVDNFGYGILFGKKNNSATYSKFQITSNHYRQFAKSENDKNEIPRDWKLKNIINGMNEWNKIKIVRTRNVIDCYVNNELTMTYGDYVEKGQDIALSSDKNGMVVEYDNFKVTTFDYEIKNVAGADKHLAKEYLPFNTADNDINVYVAVDGNTLYVTRHAENEDNSNVWISKQVDGRWGSVEKMPFPINNSAPNRVISTSSDQNTLYLMNTYKLDGSSDGAGISISNRTKDGWEIPTTIKVDSLVNKNRFVSYFFSSDNKILLTGIQPNEEDYDEQSLFVSFIKEDGSYTEPKNLGPTINTLAIGYNPTLAADNTTLYFGSTGHPGYGSGDMWITHRLDETWQNWTEPENLGPYINSSGFELSLSLDAKGDYAYLVSNDNSLPGAKGRGDIMKIELPEGAKPEPVVLVYGKVLNKNTNEPIAAKINYYDLTTGQEYGTAISDINTGEYNIVLPRGINYGFKSEVAGYVSISENLDLTNLDRYEEIEKNLYLVPIEIGQSIRLNNLFFDTGEYALKESSNSELKNLLKLLQLNPNMKIKIVGYTDNVGSDASNLTLSKNRANSVYEWLISNNIIKENISSEGMGRKDPVATNDTEEGRQLNRRVEFTIIEK